MCEVCVIAPDDLAASVRKLLSRGESNIFKKIAVGGHIHEYPPIPERDQAFPGEQAQDNGSKQRQRSQRMQADTSFPSWSNTCAGARRNCKDQEGRQGPAEAEELAVKHDVNEGDPFGRGSFL